MQVTSLSTTVRPHRGTLALLATAVCAAAIALSLRAAGAQPVGGNRMVYLAPSGASAAAGQQFSPADWQARGVKVVTRAADLVASVSPSTEAIIVDAQALPQVDRDWLRSQLRSRRAVAAVNLNLAELQEVLGDPQVRLLADGSRAPGSERAAPWKPNAPVFAAVAKSVRPDGGCYRSTQESLAAWSHDAFLAAVDRVAACARS